MYKRSLTKEKYITLKLDLSCCNPMMANVCYFATWSREWCIAIPFVEGKESETCCIVYTKKNNRIDGSMYHESSARCATLHSLYFLDLFNITFCIWELCTTEYTLDIPESCLWSSCFFMRWVSLYSLKLDQWAEQSSIVAAALESREKTAASYIYIYIYSTWDWETCTLFMHR